MSTIQNAADGLYEWQIVIEDFRMFRSPQLCQEIRYVDAPTAADAIAMAKVRYSVPALENCDHELHVRRLVDVRFCHAIR